jgi:hypothetical protein
MDLSTVSAGIPFAQYDFARKSATTWRSSLRGSQVTTKPLRFHSMHYLT